MKNERKPGSIWVYRLSQKLLAYSRGVGEIVWEFTGIE